MHSTITFVAIQILLIINLKSFVLPFVLGHFELLRDLSKKKRVRKGTVNS